MATIPNERPPMNGSRYYLKVLARGCGGYQDPLNLDYDCHHGYGWTCDDCPIVREKWRKEHSDGDS